MERKREIQTMKKINIRKPKLIYIISKDHHQQHIQDLLEVIEKKNIQKIVQSSTITLERPPSDKLELRFVVVDNKSGRVVLGQAFTSKAMIIVGYPEKGTNINNFYCSYPQQVVDKFLNCNEYAYQLSRRFQDTLSRDQSLTSKPKILVKSVACLGLERNFASAYRIPQAKKMLIFCSKKDNRQFIQMAEQLANKYEQILISYSRGQFIRFCEEPSIYKKYILATQYSILILRSISQIEVKILVFCYQAKTCLKMTSSRQLPESVEKIFTDFEELKKQIKEMNFTKFSDPKKSNQRGLRRQSGENRGKKITWAISNHSSKKKDINQFSKTIQMLDDFIIEKSTKHIIPQPSQKNVGSYYQNNYQRPSRNLQPSITRILEQQFAEQSMIEDKSSKNIKNEEKEQRQYQPQTPKSSRSCKSNTTSKSKKNYKIFRVVSSNKKKNKNSENDNNLEKKKINFEYGMTIYQQKRANMINMITSEKKNYQDQSIIKINQSLSIQSQQSKQQLHIDKTIKKAKCNNSQTEQKFLLEQRENLRTHQYLKNDEQNADHIKTQEKNDEVDTPLLMNSNRPLSVSKHRSLSEQPIRSTLRTSNCKIKRKLIMNRIPAIQKINNMKNYGQSKQKYQQQQSISVLRQLTSPNQQIPVPINTMRQKSLFSVQKKKKQIKRNFENNQVFMVHQDLYLQIVPFLLKFITSANKILPHYTEYELVKQIQAEVGKKKIFVFTEQDFQRIIRADRQKVVVVQFNNQVNTPIYSGKNVVIYKDFSMFKKEHFPKNINNTKQYSDGSDTETFQSSQTNRTNMIRANSLNQ